MECVSERELHGLATGELSPAEAARAEAHAATCTSCKARITLARGSLGATMAAPVEKPELMATMPVGVQTADTLAGPVRPDGGTLAVNTKLGRYAIQGVLGKGGMGVVYTAHDPELDRKVAVKLLRAEIAGPAAAARLLREGRAIAKLAHPNVVAVFDVGTHEGSVFVAMELVDGQSLEGWITPVRPWREVVGVFLQAGAGLGAAHDAGMVHRDFKPANVLMGRDGRVRVTDFGLAHFGGGAAEPGDGRASKPAMNEPIERLTQTGAILGTPAYMAPEQLEALPVDAKTDQFSFAASLYEALYGERPFAGTTLGELFANITDHRVKPAPSASNVPAWLRQVLLRGLRAAPDERYPTLAAMLVELRKDPGARRRRFALTATGVVGVSAAAVAGAMVFAAPTAEPPCRGAQAELARVWGPLERMRLGAAFVATGVPYARDSLNGTLATLDTWGARWAKTHTSTCEATHVRHQQSAALLDRRMACLADRKHELASFVSLLAVADAALVERAVPAAHRISAAESCDDPTLASISPPAAEIAADVAAVRSELDEVRALNAAGKYDDGIKRAAPLVERAQKVAYRPLEAEVMFDLGEAQLKKNDVAAAEATIRKGQLAAEAARDDRLSARMAIQLIDVVAYRQAKHDQADPLIDRATAAIERLGGDDGLTAMVDYYRAGIALETGKPSDALAGYQRAYERMKTAFGPDHPYTIAALDSRGGAELMLGKLDDVVVTSKLALDLTEKAQGVDHPDVAFALDKLGSALMDLHRYDEARVALERGVTLRSRNPDDPYYGASLINLGGLERMQMHYERAFELTQQAAVILTRTLGPEHPYVVQALQGASWLANTLHRPREALELANRAFTVIEKQPDSTFHSIVQTRIGEAQLALGATSAAIAALERAAALDAKQQDAAPATRPEILFALAQALRTSARATDKKRAVTVAKDARKLCEALGPVGLETINRIDAWLAGKPID